MEQTYPSHLDDMAGSRSGIDETPKPENSEEQNKNENRGDRDKEIFRFLPKCLNLFSSNFDH